MKTIVTYFQEQLSSKYEAGELRSLLYWTLEEVTGMTRTQLLLCKDTDFSLDIQEKVKKVVQKLKNDVPIQYIFGRTGFCGHTFRVNKHVLIPRPETAELVDWILSVHDSQCCRVLDVGTGSGCIAVSLKAARAEWDVCAMDKSESALSVACENADENGQSIVFISCDALDDTQTWPKVDIIVSNPPYICENERAQMEANVLEYEPSMALFVPDEDPLCFYRAIASQGQKCLSKGGELFFEINSAYGPETVQLLRSMGYENVELRKDLSGLDRMVRARKVG